MYNGQSQQRQATKRIKKSPPPWDPPSSPIRQYGCSADTDPPSMVNVRGAVGSVY